MDWLNKGLATYINKEKARAFLSHQSAPIAATAAKAELSSAAKVVENSENYKETGHKIFPQNVLWVGGCRTRRMACQDDGR